jgi:hypothetical protein
LTPQHQHWPGFRANVRNQRRAVSLWLRRFDFFTAALWRRFFSLD